MYDLIQLAKNVLVQLKDFNFVMVFRLLEEYFYNHQIEPR